MAEPPRPKAQPSDHAKTLPHHRTPVKNKFLFPPNFFREKRVPPPPRGGQGWGRADNPNPKRDAPLLPSREKVPFGVSRREDEGAAAHRHPNTCRHCRT